MKSLLQACYNMIPVCFMFSVMALWLFYCLKILFFFPGTARGSAGPEAWWQVHVLRVQQSDKSSVGKVRRSIVNLTVWISGGLILADAPCFCTLDGQIVQTVKIFRNKQTLFSSPYTFESLLFLCRETLPSSGNIV